MTKEEFTKVLNDLREREKEIRRIREQATKEYIETNSVFKAGDRVSVDGQNGVVIGNEINYDNNVIPIVNKQKKDGTPHKSARIHIWYRSKVKKL